MPRKAGNRAKAIAKGLTEYMGKRCHECGSRRRLVYRSQCVVCLDWDDGKSRTQIARQSSSYMAQRAAYERNRYYERKLMRTPLGMYLQSFKPRKEKRMDNHDIEITRASAQKAGRVTYNAGKPCKRCSTRLRYTRNGTCVECNNAYRHAHATSEAGRVNNAERQARFRARQAAKKNALLDDI